MRQNLFFLLLLTNLNLYAQENIKIEITESYELSNIILALTKYGRTDKWDVQKVSPYYNEILTFFEPVKNHPLLDSVNYSRKKWEQFLGFRTDMYAFSFDKNGELKRDYPFNSFDNAEVDKNLELINDFVIKSKYRDFYEAHKLFYNTIISNYKDYYFLNETKKFLEKIGINSESNSKRRHIIAISPLVGGQNCHRDTDSLTSVDFPNISSDLINGILNNNIKRRVVDNHTIFTEMDHGYVNPITEKFENIVLNKFNINKWNDKSGYPGISIFNEYMTWAVYDIFLKEYFPKISDSISIQWQYQNANRGFVAQNVFSKKVIELYYKQKGKKSLEKLYPSLLNWCEKTENRISQPILLNIDQEKFIKFSGDKIVINFSEEMQNQSIFKIQISELFENKETGKSEFIEIKNGVWTNNNKTLSFNIKTEYNQFAIIFNWWGNDLPLISKNNIFLRPLSYILFEK